MLSPEIALLSQHCEVQQPVASVAFFAELCWATSNVTLCCAVLCCPTSLQGDDGSWQQVSQSCHDCQHQHVRFACADPRHAKHKTARTYCNRWVFLALPAAYCRTSQHNGAIYSAGMRRNDA